jgi:hypothetical protein
MSGPLEGVRVLDLTRLLPGAFATALLGDAARPSDFVAAINAGADAGLEL